MAVAEEQQLNAGVIRRDYLDGLNATSDAVALKLREPLTEHVRALIPAVRWRMPGMSSTRRQQAEHCLTRAAETLERIASTRDAIRHTYDLAVSARALLALYRRPSPHEDQGTA